jgi:prepilin-type processing-associated H-X9-DG protein/prepilin-type N-terminal cleavage/methylation domain-containing protein
MRRHAFTLIELLVVVAILVVLIGMLMPAIGFVKAQARSVQCLANLRQIGMAMQGYAADNHGAVAPSKVYTSSTPLSPAAYPNGVHWHDLIQPYADRENANGAAENFRKGVLWGCPLWEGRSDGFAINTGWTGYGKNYVPNAPSDWHLDSQPTAVEEWSWPQGFTVFRFSQIVNPSGRIMIGDSIDWHLFPNAGEEGAFFVWSGDPLRHGRAANYLFFDGHVASCDPRSAWDGVFKADL